MLEKEYKEILNIEKYNKIHSLFEWGFIRNQINYYYLDEAQQLLLNNIHVRVRKIDEKYKLQIKYPVINTENNKTGLHIRNEEEKDIDFLPEVVSGKEIYKIAHFKCCDAKRIGLLATERKVYKPNKSIEICLDKSSYMGIVDYEIEIEYICADEDSTLTRIKDKLSGIGIYFNNKTNGKFTRFFQRYSNLKGE